MSATDPRLVALKALKPFADFAEAWSGDPDDFTIASVICAMP